MWGLVVGCVRPTSGPAVKMAGLADALARLGLDVACVLVEPGPSAPRRTAELLWQAARETDPGVVLVRSHWSLPPALPAMSRLVAQGHRVVIDVPSPAAVGVREVRAAARPLPSKAIRLASEAAWTPLAWIGASLIVQYAPDGPGWRRVAADRRLTLTNGVSVAEVPLAGQWVHRRGCTFVCVGAVGPWHGLDRLIDGMAASPADSSELLVVGDGPDLPRLRDLTRNRGLSPRVRFLGTLGGDALDAAMSRADIGVSSLGEHRRGGVGLSPLKTRDYLARGLPVIFAGDDPDLRSDPPFTLRLPDDDSVVAVPQVRAWLDRLRGPGMSEGSGVASSWQPSVPPEVIRRFAEEHLDWSTRAAAILAGLGYRSHS